MKTGFATALACIGLAAGVAAYAATAARAAERDSARLVERGQYLVDRVGMCSDCHTKRDQTGQPLRSAWLQGAPIGVAPKGPMPAWGEYAPSIAGLPAHYTEAQFVQFLQTGRRPDGSAAAPPMPPYRFSAEDARAVAAYLKTLPR